MLSGQKILFDIEFKDGTLKIICADTDRPIAILWHLFRLSMCTSAVTKTTNNTLVCDGFYWDNIPGMVTKTPSPLTTQTAEIVVRKLKDDKLISSDELTFSLKKIRATQATAQIKQENTDYQNFINKHVNLYSKEKTGFLGFFRKTNMDFRDFPNMQSVKRYASKHPNSRSARVYSKLNLKKM